MSSTMTGIGSCKAHDSRSPPSARQEATGHGALIMNDDYTIHLPTFTPIRRPFPDVSVDAVRHPADLPPYLFMGRLDDTLFAYSPECPKLTVCEKALDSSEQPEAYCLQAMGILFVCADNYGGASLCAPHSTTPNQSDLKHWASYVCGASGRASVFA